MPIHLLHTQSAFPTRGIHLVIYTRDNYNKPKRGLSENCLAPPLQPTISEKNNIETLTDGSGPAKNVGDL